MTFLKSKSPVRIYSKNKKAEWFLIVANLEDSIPEDLYVVILYDLDTMMGEEIFYISEKALKEAYRKASKPVTDIFDMVAKQSFIELYKDAGNGKMIDFILKDFRNISKARSESFCPKGFLKSSDDGKLIDIYN